jgi:hypothetical protein
MDKDSLTNLPRAPSATGCLGFELPADGCEGGAQSRQFVANDVPNERWRQRRVLVSNHVADVANADPANIGVFLLE